MKKILPVTFLLFLFSVTVIHAQIRRGDHFFRSGDYARAIPAYERGLRHSQDAAAMENLANCYRITKNYTKAEEWYSKTVAANPGCNPMVYFYYGMVLRNNGKNDEARAQFQKYMQKNPGDKKVTAQVQALDEMQVWMSQTPIYAVKPLTGINSPESDISPVMFDNGLLFVSDRGEVDILNGENAPATGRAFYAVYYSKINYQNEDSVQFGKTKKLPRTINKDYHNGPASVTEDGKLMAFNRVDDRIHLRSKHFVNRPKIYFSERKGKFWSNAKPFQYNSDAYSCAHPALSPDGQLLFFASDMPGSLGGTDIWMCKRDGDGWSKPENLGPDVNTPGDEVFPEYRKDGMLFFSSDGLPGLGGLDIFSATKMSDGKWSDVTNQGAPLNSSFDDFAVTFNSEGSRGFFTSNRPGGMGDDDVYSFKVTSKFLRISGKLLASKNTTDILPNTQVQLMTKDGKLLKTTTTDSNGQFHFDNLSSDGSYIVRMDDQDPGISAKSKYYMADDKNDLVRVTVMDEAGGKYTFQNLPADPSAPPQLLSDDDYLTIAGNLISDGQPPQPIANTAVKLTDDQGNVVQTATTNDFGAFTFSHIPPDKSYIVSLADNSDPKLAASSRISITNKSGQELMSTKPDANGKFQFKILKEDKSTLSAMTVTDADLRLDMKGTLVGADTMRTPLANTTISIMDDKGKVVQSTTTDDHGNFSFVNLPADQSYIVSVDDVKDPGLVSFGKLYIKDENGKVVKTLRLSAGGKFEFRILPLDRVTLGEVYVDDPWLQVLQMKAKAQSDSLLIIENIYYDYNDWHILPAAEITLEKVVKVMQADPSITIVISSHTDSRGTAKANLELSQKRAQAVVDYLVKRGIDKKRLTAIGYGETRLLNRCADGVDCSEEEHAKNRRTEFQINKK
ncbi:MAG TPA: SdrD B-like domain-containing protein [Bacteroidia bacterium]|nr:SdrD B-like domain-containing protein [Bacteroidia bacterium]